MNWMLWLATAPLAPVAVTFAVAVGPCWSMSATVKLSGK